jgi:hypothetical protein
MPNSGLRDEELKRLTRAYLNRRTSRPPSADLEDRVKRAAVSSRARRPIAAAAGVVLAVVASACVAAVVLAFHNSSHPTSPATSARQYEVHVMRNPGGLRLPPLDRIITDPLTISRLAADVRSLPPLPSDEHCPADLGTSYTLTFVQASNAWTAVVHAQGCQTVVLSTGQTLWASTTPMLWVDLASALGIPSSAVNPLVCDGPTPGVIAGVPCVPTG